MHAMRTVSPFLSRSGCYSTGEQLGKYASTQLQVFIRLLFSLSLKVNEVSHSNSALPGFSYERLLVLSLTIDRPEL